MIVVVSTSKDAVGYAGRCVASVARQGRNVRDHTVWHFYAASDGPTADDARAAAPADSRRLIVTVDPGPALGKARRLWAPLGPDVIVVWLDGDDELVDGALERVALLYERQDVWLTYGSYVLDDGRPDWTTHSHFGRRYVGAPRREVWRASHLKTFRAGLVNRIPLSYLERPGVPPPGVRDECGERFYTRALDHVVMLPALELAGQRYAVSSDVNCIYHLKHSGVRTDPTVARDEVELVREIRSRPALEPLTDRPW